MRQDAVAELLRRAGAGWAVVRGLVERGELVVADYGGHRFYVRRLQRAQE